MEEVHLQGEFPNHGQRVVAGQRLMQAASDIFLGWERFGWRTVSVRLLHPAASRLEGIRGLAGMTQAGMELRGMCGWTLARAHARSGDRIAIAFYLGSSDAFDARSRCSQPHRAGQSADTR